MEVFDYWHTNRVGSVLSAAHTFYVTPTSQRACALALMSPFSTVAVFYVAPASKSRGWKDSYQRSNNPENAQLTPGHSGSYLNAYISVYLPNGSGRRTNGYISFNANRNHLSPSYARLKNHTFLIEIKSNHALK